MTATLHSTTKAVAVSCASSLAWAARRALPSGSWGGDRDTQGSFSYSKNKANTNKAKTVTVTVETQASMSTQQRVAGTQGGPTGHGQCDTPATTSGWAGALAGWGATSGDTATEQTGSESRIRIYTCTHVRAGQCCPQGLLLRGRSPGRPLCPSWLPEVEAGTGGSWGYERPPWVSCPWGPQQPSLHRQPEPQGEGRGHTGHRPQAGDKVTWRCSWVVMRPRAVPAHAAIVLWELSEAHAAPARDTRGPVVSSLTQRPGDRGPEHLRARVPPRHRTGLRAGV